MRSRALRQCDILHRLKNFKGLFTLLTFVFVRGHDLLEQTIKIVTQENPIPQPAWSIFEQRSEISAAIKSTVVTRWHPLFSNCLTDPFVFDHLDGFSIIAQRLLHYLFHYSMQRVLCYLWLSALAFLVGCSSPGARQNASTAYVGGNTQTATSPNSRAYWDGDHVSGSPSMVLNLTRQTIYYYKGGQLVGMAPVSTGREGYDTPAGDFRVIQKDKEHVSTLYGSFVDASGNVVAANVSVNDTKPPGSSFKGASMPYFMRLHGGVGVHAGFLPGVPDSHGCIRMPEKMAETFFENTPIGTPVKITY